MSWVVVDGDASTVCGPAWLIVVVLIHKQFKILLWWIIERKLV